MSEYLTLKSVGSRQSTSASFSWGGVTSGSDGDFRERERYFRWGLEGEIFQVEGIFQARRLILGKERDSTLIRIFQIGRNIFWSGS